MITFRQRGSFDKTERYLKKLKQIDLRPILERYAKEGVHILESNTPVDSGISAGSWGYEIEIRRPGFSLKWTNDNVTSNGVPIVILLHYGHATRGGTYVAGRDFINPVMRPLFDSLSENIWKEVNSA